MDDEDRVRYLKEGPSHAVEDALTLEVLGPGQGQGSFSRTPVEIEVSAGDMEFREGEIAISLKFRRVFVALILENCHLAIDGRYERTLDGEKYKHLIKQVEAVARSVSGNASAELGIGAKLLSYVGIKASAGGAVKASSGKDNTSMVESNLPFKIVRFVSGSRWEIGHQLYGDPLTTDHLLRGSYLNPEPDEGGEEGKNRLGLIVPDGGGPYAAYIDVRARKLDLVFEPLPDAETGRRRRLTNLEIIEKLACIKAFQEQNRADGVNLPEGEILLARARIAAERDLPQREDDGN